jgi:type 1 glutamine amidotransferase
MMRRLIFAALLGAALPGRAQLTDAQAKRIDAALPGKARVAPGKPRRVLIWNTPFMEESPHKGYCIPQGEYAMKRLGEKTGAYIPVVSDDVAMYLPKNLTRFDAIVMNNSNGHWIRPTAEDLPRLREHGDSLDALEKLLKESLLVWLTGGGGIVAYHHAMAGNPKWPVFAEIIGAGYWGHPWNEEVGVRLEEPNHPLLAAFTGRGFRIAEEIFQFREPYSRSRLRVLLTLDTERTNMTVSWIDRKDGDFALAWIRDYGKGRVFYGEFGHRTETWWNPVILRFYLDAIQYAAGDLPADAVPSARGP